MGLSSMGDSPSANFAMVILLFSKRIDLPSGDIEVVCLPPSPSETVAPPLEALTLTVTWLLPVLGGGAGPPSAETAGAMGSGSASFIFGPPLPTTKA